MKIYVISIKRNEKRLDFISKRLRSLGLDYELIEGIDSHEMQHTELERINTDFYFNLHGIRMSKSEIACALSHRRAYQHLLSSNFEKALILEDDAYPLSSTPEILNKLSEVDFYDLLYLYHGKAKKSPIYQKLPHNYRLHRYLRPSKNSRRAIIYAVAYILTSAAAKKLLEIGNHKMMPADFLIGMPQLHKLKTYGVEPNCVDHGHFQTSINDRLTN